MAAAHKKIKILGGGGLDGGVLNENTNASDEFFQSVEDQDAHAVQLLNLPTLMHHMCMISSLLKCTRLLASVGHVPQSRRI